MIEYIRGLLGTKRLHDQTNKLRDDLARLQNDVSEIGNHLGIWKRAILRSKTIETSSIIAGSIIAENEEAKK